MEIPMSEVTSIQTKQEDNRTISLVKLLRQLADEVESGDLVADSGCLILTDHADGPLIVSQAGFFSNLSLQEIICITEREKFTAMMYEHSKSS